jgi:FkbH-like protein
MSNTNTTLSINEQKVFSFLSNDYNPIHLDFEYSKKSPYSKPVIYGILIVLKSLENLIIFTKKKFINIRVEFIKFINVDDNINIEYNDNLIIIYKNINTICTKIKYTLIDDQSNIEIQDYNNNLNIPLNDYKPCQNYTHKLNINSFYLEKYFKNIYKNFNLLQIYQIINLSAFVGMITPGLNSLFNSFEINFDDNNYEDIYILDFKLNYFDNTYKTCSYNFNGKNTKGNLQCVYRPENVKQIKLKDILIKNDQFKNEKVLVIGGSRGIGEVISKIFYAGGAEVMITYYNSYNDALAICEESDNNIKIVKYNVLLDFDKINDIIDNIEFTKIFYMATPNMIENEYFNINTFDIYYNYYCKGFNLLFEKINKKNLKYIFYPSSEYLNIKNNYKEYSLAKKMGEDIIKTLAYNNKNIKFDCIRLPRLLTDLTNSIINDLSQNPYDYLIKHLNIIEKKKDIVIDNNITILSNLNIDFILEYINNNNNKYLNNNYKFNTLQFGQLYQTLISSTINSSYLFFLLSLEDILNEDIIFYNKSKYKDKLDKFYEILLNFCNNHSKSQIYFFKLKQKYISPFDDSNYNVQELLGYFNKKITNIPNIKIIENYFNDKIFDLDFYLESRSSFSLNFYEYLSNKITAIILSNLGMSIKCIVVDLDNTLWGGVLTDDGIENIEISNDYPGNKWNLFQKVLKTYQEKGIILAICSKNDKELVLKALEANKNYLKKEDFIVIQANWNPKSQNINEISKILNISVEHILFIDDNSIEREEVRQNLPKCNILEIKNIDPLHYINQLLICPLSINNNVLESDLQKHKQYTLQTEYENQKSSIGNLNDFYFSLNTFITFKYIDDTSFKRSLQLILKTNQFNLNKYIFNEEEFGNYLNNNIGIILEYTDKFTNFDQVGVILLKETDNEIIIDNIILSCRVFNRDFEKCIFILIKKILHFRQKNICVGNLLKTDKNKNFHNIYENNNFYENNGKYIYNINNEIYNYPEWINCNDHNIFNIDIKYNISEKNIKSDKKYDVINNNDIINDINIDINKDIIKDIKIFVFDSLFCNDYDANSFYNIENFSSIKMVMLLGMLKNKYTKFSNHFVIKIFYNKSNKLVSIDIFCKRIFDIINNNDNILIDNNSNKNLEYYNISVINNNSELNKVNDFLIETYNKKFAFLDEEILRWNLKGYTDLKTDVINILHTRSKFFENDYKVLGVLFSIDIYLQTINNSKLEFDRSKEIMIWNYKKESKSSSLDPINYLMDNNKSILVSNLIVDTSMEVLKNIGFHIIQEIPCYVIALDYSYENLIIDTNVSKNEIYDWIKIVKENNTIPLENINFNENLCNILEELWIEFSIKYNLLSIYKNSNFFKWRFIQSKYYEYYINGNIDEGYIIWRKEETITKNIGVRILEILPGKESIKDDIFFKILIGKFIKYCILENFEVIDFLCTSTILNEILTINNFKLKNIDNTGITSVPIFYKYRSHVKKRNMGIYLKNENLLSKHTLYFTKSLSDFDRPNCRICKRPFCDKLDVDDICI